MIIRPVGAEFFHVDGQIDMTKLIVSFRKFENAPDKPVPYIVNKICYSERCLFWCKLHVLVACVINIPNKSILFSCALLVSCV
jgi:hypothetical protein